MSDRLQEPRLSDETWRIAGEREAFQAAMLAGPTEDASRLAYADWLEARGDLRGEYLRIAVAVRTAALAPEDLKQRLHRLKELRPAVAPVWLVHAYPELADDLVREVVFRKLGFHGFVQVEDGRDPSPFMLALLDEGRAEVRPASAAEWRAGGYFDKRSGFHGCMYSIRRLSWQDVDRCDVDGEFFHDGLAASGDLYEAGVRDGWWAVPTSFNLWIS